MAWNFYEYKGGLLSLDRELNPEKQIPVQCCPSFRREGLPNYDEIGVMETSDFRDSLIKYAVGREKNLEAVEQFLFVS